MDLLAAQRTRVVHLPAFLSAEEIKTLHVLAGEVSASLPGYSKARSWKVIFLQRDGMFKERCPGLFETLRAAVLRVDCEHWKLIGDGSCNLRVAEYHTHVAPSEGLPDPRHYDKDSLVTIDVLLGEDAFDGGNFQTLEPDGSFTKHPCGVGDALLFVSHKYHCVTPLVAGVRKVLVLEFWRGSEQRCGYRYEVPSGAPLQDSSNRVASGGIAPAETLDSLATEWGIFD